MRKVIFGLLFMFSLVLSANESYEDEFQTCTAEAFGVSDAIYDQTGDGFLAGAAFEHALEACWKRKLEEQMQ